MLQTSVLCVYFPKNGFFFDNSGDQLCSFTNCVNSHKIIDTAEHECNTLENDAIE